MFVGVDFFRYSGTPQKSPSVEVETGKQLPLKWRAAGEQACEVDARKVVHSSFRAWKRGP